MHILLSVLAVIGKILLIIVLILLLLVLALLLVPLRYQLQALKTPGQKPGGTFRISWLLRMISVDGTVSSDRSVNMTLRLAGFRVKTISRGGSAQGSGPDHTDQISDSGSGQGASDTGTKEDYFDYFEEDSIEAEVSPGAETSPGGSGSDLSPEEAGTIKPGEAADRSEDPEKICGQAYTSKNGEQEKTAQSTDTSKPPEKAKTKKRRKQKKLPEKQDSGKKKEAKSSGSGLAGKLQTVFDKICGVFPALADLQDILISKANTIEDKIDGVIKTKDRWMTGPNEAAVRHVIRRLFILLRHYLPRTVWGYLRFGTGMPDITGILTGAVFQVLPAGSDKYDVTPEFNGTCFETDTSVSGYIRMVHVLIGAAALLLDKNFRKLLGSLRHARKGGKNG